MNKAGASAPGRGTFASSEQESCEITVWLGQVRPELQGRLAVPLLDSRPWAGVNLFFDRFGAVGFRDPTDAISSLVVVPTHSGMPLNHHEEA